jgi:hypothetical protein
MPDFLRTDGPARDSGVVKCRSRLTIATGGGAKKAARQRSNMLGEILVQNVSRAPNKLRSAPLNPSKRETLIMNLAITCKPNKIGTWKLWSIVAMASALCCTAASAATINFATGQSGAGVIQTGGGVDAHWMESNAPSPLDAPHTFVVTPGKVDWNNEWMANNSSSAWIAANPNGGPENSNMTWTYTFDLSGLDTSAATFSGGLWAVDSGGTLSLNGHLIQTQAFGGWHSLNAFDLPTADLVAGQNHLVIQSTNSDHLWEAARLQGLLSIAGNTTSDVPEPAGLALLGIGLLGVTATRRRTRGAKA